MQPNAERFTENAWAAILAAQSLAKDKKHQNIEAEHLFKALINQSDLTVQIISKSGSSIGILNNLIDIFLEGQPKLQSIPESIYIGNSFPRPPNPLIPKLPYNYLGFITSKTS